MFLFIQINNEKWVSFGNIRVIFSENRSLLLFSNDRIKLNYIKFVDPEIIILFSHFIFNKRPSAATESSALRSVWTAAECAEETIPPVRSCRASSRSRICRPVTTWWPNYPAEPVTSISPNCVPAATIWVSSTHFDSFMSLPSSSNVKEPRTCSRSAGIWKMAPTAREILC